MRGRLNGRRNERAFGCTSGRALHMRARINDLTSEFAAAGDAPLPTPPSSASFFLVPCAFTCARWEEGEGHVPPTSRTFLADFFPRFPGFRNFIRLARSLLITMASAAGNQKNVDVQKYIGNEARRSSARRKPLKSEKY
jgi:hypothetical protein